MIKWDESGTMSHRSIVAVRLLPCGGLLLTSFALFTTAVWVLGIVLMLAGTGLSLAHYSRKRAVKTLKTHEMPPVSVLKPVKGLESGLRDNLERFFNLDYPQYELLFSVADDKDPACDIVRALMVAYPQVKSQLILGDMDCGPNPKINNLVKGYDAATSDWLLISDSNARVEPDYLKRLVSYIDTDVGMVTSAISGEFSANWPGHLESVILNSFYTRNLVSAYAIGQTIVVGKSMMFRKSIADRFGGLRALANYLAEDYIAGQFIRQQGYRIVLTQETITQFVDRMTLRAYWLRHVRWGRIRKAQAPLVFLIEPWFSAFASSAIGAWGLSYLSLAPFYGVFFVSLLTWWCCDLALMRVCGGSITPHLALAWFVREASAFPLWISIASGSTVEWRGRKFKIRLGGSLIEQ